MSNGSIKKNKNKCIIAMILTIIIVVSSATMNLIADGSKSILGTNKALNSPILNNDFVKEDWNKWEMVCWGVFLSNYVKPLVDDYKSAFSLSGTGSNGAGLKALEFGAGSNTTNNKVIEGLLAEAITFQTQYKSDLYVAYSKFEKGEMTEAADPNNHSRIARFNDLFMQAGMTSDKSSYDNAGIVSGTKLWWGTNTKEDNEIYCLNGYVPTFYIKTETGEFVTVLDYSNGWDMAISGCIISATIDSEYSSKFKAKFDEYKGYNDVIYLDSFGNVVTSDRHIVVPASANENLRTDKHINLLNSVVIDMCTMRTNKEDLVKNLCQDMTSTVLSRGNLANLDGSTISKERGFLYFEMPYTVYSKNSNYWNVNSTSNGLRELMNSEINNSTLELKIELVGDSKNKGWGAGFSEELNANMCIGNSLAVTSNTLNGSGNKTEKEYYSTLVNIDGKEFNAFEDYIMTSVITKPGNSEAERYRLAVNWVYESYAGKENNTASVGIRNYFNSLDKFGASDAEYEYLDEFNKNFKSKYLKAFESSYSEYKGWKDDKTDFGQNESFNKKSRIIKVCLPSNALCEVARTLGIEDGSNFKTYSTLLYATYLEFYEIGYSNGLYQKEYTSAFDTKIFNNQHPALGFDIKSSDIKFSSEEEKQKEITEMSYLMLSTEQGREYRKTLLTNTITDFCYENYNRIVYGSSTKDYSGMASGDSTGFLSIGSFAENWILKPIVNNYAVISVVLMSAGVVILIILSIIRRKGIFWLFVSLLVFTCSVILMPLTGEIAPYIVEKSCANIFSDNTTLWNLSEMIINRQTSEATEIDADNGEEKALISSLVENLSVVHADSALMMKQDTSLKVTQKTGGIYRNIQKYKSARWLIPVIIQEFSSDNGSAGYVYVSLENIVKDGDNIYYYFGDGTDSIIDDTIISRQFCSNNTIASGEARKNAESNYEDLVKFDELNKKNNSVNYNNFSYTLKENSDDITHLYSFYLKDKTIYSRNNSVINMANTYENVDSWGKYTDYWANANSSQVGSWETSSEGNFEDICEEHDRRDADTMKADYAYYRLSENNYYYFYDVVRDQLSGCSSLARLNSTLTGKVENYNGEAVRNNFMYATVCEDESKYCTNGNTRVGVFDSSINGIQLTGKTRDILDLKNLFENVVPYMYQTTLYTGGFDGESGILGDSKISDKSQFYGGTNQSWVYRCNWAVKIMENPKFSKSCIIKDKDGNKYEVKNPMLYECYPSERPMVFSEAQMLSYGLLESDLSDVELKCVNINRDIAKKWTYLVNYVSLDNMKLDIMFKQMAVIATNEFNREFSNGIISSTYNVYPTTIDLRYLSFDSVLKNILINNTGSMSYAYGSTIDNIMSQASLGTAILLLVIAWLCSRAVAFIQSIIIAMIFILGILAIFRNMTMNTKYKLKVAGSQLVMNAIFIVLTLAYYYVLGLMMRSNKYESVLVKGNSVGVEYGSVTGILWVILLVTLVYTATLIGLIVIIWKSKKDMGLNFLENMTISIKGMIQDKIDGNYGSDINTQENYNDSSSEHSDSSVESSSEDNRTINISESNNDDGQDIIEQIDETDTYERGNSKNELDSRNREEIRKIEEDMRHGEENQDIYEE